MNFFIYSRFLIPCEPLEHFVSMCINSPIKYPFSLPCFKDRNIGKGLLTNLVEMCFTGFGEKKFTHKFGETFLKSHVEIITQIRPQNTKINFVALSSVPHTIFKLYRQKIIQIHLPDFKRYHLCYVTLVLSHVIHSTQSPAPLSLFCIDADNEIITSNMEY